MNANQGEVDIQESPQSRSQTLEPPTTNADQNEVDIQEPPHSQTLEPPTTNANQGEVDIQEPLQLHLQTLDRPISLQSDGHPESPTQHLGPPTTHPKDEQEYTDTLTNRAQETDPPNQASQSITQLPSLVDSEPPEPRPRFPGNSDEQITELPRQEETVIVRVLYLSYILRQTQCSTDCGTYPSRD